MSERTYRTLDQTEEDYYRNHPDEIDGYLTTCFEEYAQDGCTPELLSSLRMVARIKGVSATADSAGLTRNGLQKALSEQGNPKFESVNAIMQAMGYRLTPEKLETPHVDRRSKAITNRVIFAQSSFGQATNTQSPND